MLNAIGVIARARFLLVRNTLWRGKLGRKIGWVFLALALSFAAYGIYWLMSAAVRELSSDAFQQALAEIARTTPDVNIPTNISAYLVALPSAALFAALLLLVLTSFSTVLSSLYLSGDIDMLLVAPVPMRAVFVVKFFGGLLLPYLLLFLLIGPALVGFGQGMGYGVAYYAVLVLSLALLPLLPFSIGALLVMAVVRVVPARRARDIVSVIGGLIGVAWYIFSQFSRQISDQISGAQTLSWLERLNNPLLPSAWVGRALNAAGTGEWATLLIFGGLFGVLSVGAFVAALVLGERVYYEGWSNMATQGGKVRRRARDQGRAPEGASSQSFVDRLSSLILPPESAAILFKDLRVFPRDLRNLQQLIFPLAMSGIWTFNLVAQGPSRINLPGVASSALALLFPAGITAFICLTLSSALGGPNISREGKGFWQLKIAPVSGLRILLGKFVLAYLPYPTVGTLFIVLISVLQRNRPQDALAALALVLLTGMGVCAITLGMGAAFPKFNWEKPSDQSSLQAGCLAPIFYLFYLGLSVGVALGLPLVGTFFPDWSLLFTALGWLLALALTIGVTWGFLAYGARSLERIEV